MRGDGNRLEVGRKETCEDEAATKHTKDWFLGRNGTKQMGTKSLNLRVEPETKGQPNAEGGEPPFSKKGNKKKKYDAKILKRKNGKK